MALDSLGRLCTVRWWCFRDRELHEAAHSWDWALCSCETGNVALFPGWVASAISGPLQVHVPYLLSRAGLFEEVTNTVSWKFFVECVNKVSADQHQLSAVCYFALYYFLWGLREKLEDLKKKKKGVWLTSRSLKLISFRCNLSKVLVTSSWPKLKMFKWYTIKAYTLKYPKSKRISKCPRTLFVYLTK